MPTEKQIAANRTNALRSTGPKTAAGKLKSSRNAYRYGLSGPAPLDPATLAKVNSIACELAGERATEERLAFAADFARAQVELMRIRSIRTEQFAEPDLRDHNLKKLARLAALDRYERYALTRRRKASKKLKCED
jgi:hypothetical protein